MTAELISAINLNEMLCLETEKIGKSDNIILQEYGVTCMYLGCRNEREGNVAH